MDLKAVVDERIRRFGSTKRDRFPGVIGGLKPMTDGMIEPITAVADMMPEQTKLSMAIEPSRKTYKVGMIPPDLRAPSYWYKQHEVENERSKKVPNTVAMNAMMYKNMQKQNLPYITKEQMKMQDRQDQIALQLKAEFMRPKAVVFDSQGKFHRTRVDEQSWL